MGEGEGESEGEREIGREREGAGGVKKKIMLSLVTTYMFLLLCKFQYHLMQTLVVHKQKGIGKGSSCAMNLISYVMVTHHRPRNAQPTSVAGQLWVYRAGYGGAAGHTGCVQRRLCSLVDYLLR